MTQRKITKLIPPRDISDQKVGAALREVYQALNYILERLSAFDLEARRTDTGAKGDIRVVFDRGTKTATIEAKTDYGWYGIELQELGK